ncbi:hypothetical protein D3C80_1176400 [compost metagenome]
MEGPIFPKPTPSSSAKALSSASRAKTSQLWKRARRSRSREIRCPPSPCSRPTDFSFRASGRACSTKAVWSASSGMVLARSLTKGMARKRRASSSGCSVRPRARWASSVSLARRSSSARRSQWALTWASLSKSRRAGALLTPVRSNQARACSSLNSSSSPCAQPRRAR